MKIYVAHSSGFDFEHELYSPLRSSALNLEHDFIFPHDNSLEATFSKTIIEQCDLFLAEVSYASTGLGIELGWADAANINIIAFYRDETFPSSSLNVLDIPLLKYTDSADMVHQIQNFLSA